MSMQPATPPGDLEAIAHLDHDPACDIPAPYHDSGEPAKYALNSRCCGVGPMLVCEDCWRSMVAWPGFGCKRCGGEFPHRDDALVIVAQIGGLR